MKRSTSVAYCSLAATITCCAYVTFLLPGRHEVAVPVSTEVTWNDSPIVLPDYVPVWRQLPRARIAAFALVRSDGKPKAQLYLFESADSWSNLFLYAHDMDQTYRVVHSTTNIKLPNGRNRYEFSLICLRSRSDVEVRWLIWAKAAAKDHWLGMSGVEADLPKLTETADALFANAGVNTDLKGLAQECIQRP